MGISDLEIVGDNTFIFFMYFYRIYSKSSNSKQVCLRPNEINLITWMMMAHEKMSTSASYTLKAIQQSISHWSRTSVTLRRGTGICVKSEIGVRFFHCHQVKDLKRRVHQLHKSYKTIMDIIETVIKLSLEIEINYHSYTLLLNQKLWFGLLKKALVELKVIIFTPLQQDGTCQGQNRRSMDILKH